MMHFFVAAQKKIILQEYEKQIHELKINNTINKITIGVYLSIGLCLIVKWLASATQPLDFVQVFGVFFILGMILKNISIIIANAQQISITQQDKNKIIQEIKKYKPQAKKIVKIIESPQKNQTTQERTVKNCDS